MNARPRSARRRPGILPDTLRSARQAPGAALCLLAAAFALPAQQPGPALLYGYEDGLEANVRPVAIASPGDLDGDGVADLLCGQPSARGGDGLVQVRSGRSGEIIDVITGRPGANDRFGFPLAPLGDLDGDGVAEFAVTALNAKRRGVWIGRVTIHSGATGNELRALWGLGDGDFFGSAVSAVGDVDADGVTDFAIGAPENGNPVVSYDTGYVQVFSGADFRQLHLFEGVEVGDEFGSAIAGVGDIDGDGHADLMVGALLEYPSGHGQGSARVYSGRTGTVLHGFFAFRGTDHFGLNVGAVGDLDGDGSNELFVTGIGMTSPDRGSLSIYSGRTGALRTRVLGDGDAGMFGRRAAPAGDLTGDGIPDLVITDPMARRAGTRYGAVHVVSGADGAIAQTTYGPAGNAGFGSWLAMLPDLDRDGRREIGLGVPGWPQAGAAPRPRLAVLTTARDVARPGRGCAMARGSQEPTLDTTGARIGTAMPLWLAAGTPAASRGALLASPQPLRPLALPGLAECTLYVDPAQVVTLTTVATNAAGRWLGWVGVPGDPSLAGARLALQAALISPAGGLELTHGLQVTVAD